MRWLVQPNPNPETVQSLSKALGVTEVVAQLLVQRGITNFDSAKQFFRPEWHHLHDPFLMKDMHVAVHRLQQAIDKKETVMVFGDYDVDGTSAVSLLVHYLQHQKMEVISYIPDRYSEGYGLSQQGIDKAVEEGVGLLFTLDCGIKAVDLISDTNQKGIDVIICDHHTPGEQLPEVVPLAYDGHI